MRGVSARNAGASMITGCLVVRLVMKKGFTVIEVIISTLVLSILATGIMFLFQRSNSAFSITLWKQERTKQAEIFWTHFRKCIEEASDYLEIPDDQMGKPHPEDKKKEIAQQQKDKK